MANYTKILETFYPDMEWSGGSDTDYSSLEWKGGTPTSIPAQGTLDTWDSYISTVKVTDHHIVCRNESGSTIAKGTPVYASGVDGTAAQTLIAPCDADNGDTFPCIGITDVEILNNTSGVVKFEDKVEDIDTSSHTKNDIVYVASGGGMTSVRPVVTKFVQKIGTVDKDDATEGTIKVDLSHEFVCPPNSSSATFTKTTFSCPDWITTTAPTQALGTLIGSAIITPATAEKTIKIEVSLVWDTADDSDYVVSIWRDTTRVGVVPINLANRGYLNHSHFVVYDEPNTTNSTTYSVYIHGEKDSVIYINQSKDLIDAGGTFNEATGLFLFEM